MLAWTKNLQLYLNNKLNVLLCGHGGVGKTMVIKNMFNKQFGNEWLYIAGATADPFIDLIGIPKPIKDTESGQEVIEFIKPKKLQLNKVRGIFCDEYNRAPKRVMNALMEIIQFKTLNGEPVPNLEVIWCAINPDDEDYNIEEKLDRSQKDRFHIWVDVPYMIDTEYFNNTFGSDITDGVKEWWNGLPDNVRKLVSPRRLEYAIQVFNINGDLREVLPPSTNISQLTDNLINGSMKSQLIKLMKDKESVVAQKLKDNPNLMTAISNKLDDAKFSTKFAHLIPEEILVQKAPGNLDLCQYIKQNSNKFPTSTIVSLDKLGCFDSSSFGPMALILNKNFPNTSYTAKDRKKLHKVFASIPDITKCSIKPKDMVHIQKLVDIAGHYCSNSNYGTVPRDDRTFKFIEKFVQLEDACTKLNLTLNFNNNNIYNAYRGLVKYMQEYKDRQKREQEKAKTAQATQTI